MSPPAPDLIATDAVHRERLRIDARHEDDERRLCRLWLQANIVSVSPLALDIAAEAGIVLDEACDAIVPEMARRWRSVRSGRMFHHRIRYVARPKGLKRYLASPLDHVLARRVRRQGALFGDIFSEEGWTGFAVGASVLEVTGRLGPCWFGSCLGKAWLTLPAGVPDTLAAALPGRQLDAAVSHPAFSGKGYRIMSVDDLGDGCRAMVFRTGVAPFEMPWGELLQGVLTGNR